MANEIAAGTPEVQSTEEIKTPTEEVKVEKPVRTPEEELAYFEGRAKRIRKDLGLDKEEPKTSKKNKPSELDYGQLAFYNTKSDSIKIESEDDIRFLEQTIEDTGKSQTQVLNSKWFQAELKDRRDQRAVADATPKGQKRSPTPQKDEFSVVYAEYLDTGKLPEDRVLREKVVNERIAREKGKLYGSA